jgi:hypothetical protein
MAAALIVGVGAAVFELGISGGGSGGGGGGAPARPAAAPAARTPARPGATPPGTTPPPPPAAPVLLGTSQQAAVYRVSGPTNVSVVSTGRCWVEIRHAGPSGPIVYSAVLTSGSQQSVAAPVWLRIGNPAAVTVTIDGSAISPPGLSASAPYNLQFQTG